MIYRQLGATGLSVSVVGLGCSHLGPRRGGPTRDQLVRLLDHAVERGITFFDTADVYMAGESERLLGEVLTRHRERIVVATKVGFHPILPAALLGAIRPYLWAVTRRGGGGKRLLRGVRDWLQRADFSPRHLRSAVEASLIRLRTDRIDVLQLHSPTAAALEREGVLDTLERLVGEGKVRFHGLAFATCAKAESAVHARGFATLQLPVSIADPTAADTLLAWAEHRRVGVIANQTLAGGMLGRARDDSDVEASSTRAQAAIRFAVHRRAVSTVIVGTTSMDHLDQNVAALDGPTPPGTELATSPGIDHR